MFLEILVDIIGSFLEGNEKADKAKEKINNGLNAMQDYVGKEQERMYKAEERMSSKSDDSLKRIVKDNGYSMTDRKAAMNELKSRNSD